MAAWQRAYAGDAALDLAAALGPAQPTQRGGADALAAWRRWHPPALNARFSPAQWPWYAILERARVETLAGRDLPGMALNLADLAALAPANDRTRRLYRLARRMLATPPGQATQSEEQQAPAPPPAPQKPRSTPPHAMATRIARRLGWYRARPPVEAPDQGPPDERIVATLRQTLNNLTDATTFAEQVRPLVEELARSAGPDPIADTQPSTQPLLPEDAEEDGNLIPDNDAEANRMAANSPEPLPADRRYAGYAIYSTLWDQTLDARQLYRPSDALNLQQIDETDQQQARRLALRLQRRLLAARLRRWSFDRDEGRLDSRRLARLLTPKPPYAVFRQEDETPVPEACVTLLVDQSGSMRGLPQRLTAQAIDLAVQTLEICRVRCEVLGYTTRYGADNPLIRSWQANDRPAHPGRLNALRHIIYKRADQPWRRCRKHLGLLLREGLGRENIDGEALDWAARRLLAAPEPRKILIVLSDGAPYDEASATANGRGFLEDHLHAVIAALEASPIQLAAIGAGQTAGRYYHHALTLQRPADVAAVLLEHLGDLLTPPNR